MNTPDTDDYQPACWNCTYFDYPDDDWTHIGHCRALPPTINGFPEIHEDQWCGGYSTARITITPLGLEVAARLVPAPTEDPAKDW